MIGKVTVTTKNPPCRGCGRMAGRHSKDCGLAANKALEVAERASKRHEFSLDDFGEFDEVFVKNASVHIERMDETAYWIGIDAPGMASLMVNTGTVDGVWYFNVEEDSLDGRDFSVQRPRRPKRSIRPKHGPVRRAAR